MKPKIKIESSATVTINSLALEKKKKGERVFNLSAGEPMIDTPEIIKQAGINAINNNQTHYPPVAGLPELREGAVRWMNREYGADYGMKNVLLTAGGKFGLFLVLQAFVGAEDEVLIPAPYWVSYPAMVKIFGGVPRYLQTTQESGWKISADDLKGGISENTKILILNNGSNPTGVLYSKEELENILQIAKENNILVISDEVYSGLVYDDNEYVSATSFSEFNDNVLVIQSCSKNFAMTGWRVGFVFGDTEIIKTLTSLTSQSTSGVTSISQWAVVAALQNAEKIIPEIKTEMQKRRDIFISAFVKNFDVELDIPKCGLYCFITMSAFGIEEKDSLVFCERVLKEASVAMVPGIAFGCEGYVRCSFGESGEELEEALEKLSSCLRG